MGKKSRLLNFELLRVLSMLFIITGHLLGDNGGNLLGKQEPFTISWLVLWAIEAFLVSGTNCFVLISGFFLVEHQFTWKKVFNLCIEVWFYSVIIYFSCLALGLIQFEKRSMLAVFTPILGRTWWFISTYLGMYILSPFLNLLLKSIDGTTHKKLIVICMILFSVISSFYPFTDTFRAGGGGGIVWFLSLYIIAAYIRLHWEEIHVVQNMLIKVYFSSVGLLIISKYGIAFLTKMIFGEPVGTSVFFSNCSIINTVASVSLFLIFAKLRMDSLPNVIQKAILWAGGMPFGVYLIHNNPWLSPVMWNRVIDWFYSDRLVVQLLMVANLPIAIYFICGLIDTSRKRLFVLLKVPQ